MSEFSLGNEAVFEPFKSLYETVVPSMNQFGADLNEMLKPEPSTLVTESRDDIITDSMVSEFFNSFNTAKYWVSRITSFTEDPEAYAHFVSFKTNFVEARSRLLLPPPGSDASKQLEHNRALQAQFYQLLTPTVQCFMKVSKELFAGYQSEQVQNAFGQLSKFSTAPNSALVRDDSDSQRWLSELQTNLASPETLCQWMDYTVLLADQVYTRSYQSLQWLSSERPLRIGFADPDPAAAAAAVQQQLQERDARRRALQEKQATHLADKRELAVDPHYASEQQQHVAAASLGVENVVTMYWDNSAVAEHTVHAASDGTLFVGKSVEAPVLDGKWGYVVTVDGRLLVFREQECWILRPDGSVEEKKLLNFSEALQTASSHDGTIGVTHHSSPQAGKRVQAAGMLVAKEGRLLSLNNESGHYKPPFNAVEQVASYLIKNNFASAATRFGTLTKSGPREVGTGDGQILQGAQEIADRVRTHNPSYAGSQMDAARDAGSEGLDEHALREAMNRELRKTTRERRNLANEQSPPSALVPPSDADNDSVSTPGLLQRNLSASNSPQEALNRGRKHKGMGSHNYTTLEDSDGYSERLKDEVAKLRSIRAEIKDRLASGQVDLPLTSDEAAFLLFDDGYRAVVLAKLDTDNELVNAFEAYRYED